MGGDSGHRGSISGDGTIQTSYKLLWDVHILFMVVFAWLDIVMDGHILLKWPAQTFAKSALPLRFCLASYRKPF